MKYKISNQTTILNNISQKQFAFTLIESIISIAIISGLLGLLLPAVQQVRAASQKSDCQNRQRQLVVGLQNYESQTGYFPKGATPHPTLPIFYYRSWQIEILPFIEQENLMINIEQILFDQVNNNTDIRGEMAYKVFRFLICPSNQISITPAGGPTHYIGTSGKQWWFDTSGILAVNKSVRTAEITDGLSNTLILMERPTAQKDLCYAWFNSANNCYLTSTQMGIYNAPNYSNGAQSFGPNPYKKWDPTHIGSGYGPWSYHSGGSNFALADGSVRFIRYSAGSILPAMATRAGGEVFDLP